MTTMERTAPVKAPDAMDEDGFLIDVADQVSAQQIEKQAPLQAAQVGDVGEASRTVLSEDPALRNSQLAQAQRLEAQASGTAPSVAEQQFGQNLDRIMKAQHAQAASARGSQGSLLAQREATLAGQDMMQEAGRESAMMRMQEQQQAEQQLSGVLESIRSMDMTQLIKQAELDQQTSLANLNVRVETALTNARMRQESALTEYSTEFERQRANQNAQLQADLANQATNLQTEITNAQNKVSVAMTNFQAALQTEIANKELQSKESSLIFSQEQENLRQGRQLAHEDTQLDKRLAQERQLHDSSNAHALKMQAEELAVRKALQLSDTITKLTLANEEFALRWTELGISGNEKDRDYVLKTIEAYQQQQQIDNAKLAQGNLDQNQKAQLKLEAEKFKAGQPNEFEKTMKNFGYGVEMFGGAMKAIDTILGWF